MRLINKNAPLCTNSTHAMQLACYEDDDLKQFNGEGFQQRSLVQVAISQQKNWQSALHMPKPTHLLQKQETIKPSHTQF